MYCANCGVKLADTEKKCPLCGVMAFHPDIVRPEGESFYPNDTFHAQIQTTGFFGNDLTDASVQQDGRNRDRRH